MHRGKRDVAVLMFRGSMYRYLTSLAACIVRVTRLGIMHHGVTRSAACTGGLLDETR